MRRGCFMRPITIRYREGKKLLSLFSYSPGRTAAFPFEHPLDAPFVGIPCNCLLHGLPAERGNESDVRGFERVLSS